MSLSAAPRIVFLIIAFVSSNVKKIKNNLLYAKFQE